MFFIVLANDRPDALPDRLAARQKHLDYWAGLPGTVKVAGAMLTGDDSEATPKGSAFILEAENLAAARALVAADPFTALGIFSGDVRIEVLRPAIGDWKPA
jgi:uncharacterized protein YciI